MFNCESLSAFSEFQSLSSELQDTILELVEEDRLNKYGHIKRAANSWIFYRSDMFALLKDKTINQAEFSQECQKSWKQMSDVERAPFRARAVAKSAEILQLFPDYKFRPMVDEDLDIWLSMSPATKKRYWLAAVARIAKRVMNPNGRWDGFLSPSSWARNDPGFSALSDANSSKRVTTSAAVSQIRATSGSEVEAPRQAHHASVPTANKRNAIRGCGSDSLQPEKAHSHTRGSHPYQQARDLASTQVPAQYWSAKLPEWFLQWAESFLVRLDNNAVGKKRRRPVLAMFQLLGANIYVEEEIPNDVPDDVYDDLALGEVPKEDIFLRGYSNPFVPEAQDEYGIWYTPKFKSVAEYNGYIDSYHESEDLSTSFWPLVGPARTQGPETPDYTNHASPLLSAATTPSLAPDNSPAFQPAVTPSGYSQPTINADPNVCGNSELSSETVGSTHPVGEGSRTAVLSPRILQGELQTDDQPVDFSSYLLDENETLTSADYDSMIDELSDETWAANRLFLAEQQSASNGLQATLGYMGKSCGDGNATHLHHGA
ncbi:hypothetical protein FRC07_014985 [Ceratobasidium sp. 392]|nr:hypothetical protein FRC07_014985 [Ceratobasidium sp. 392]